MAEKNKTRIRTPADMMRYITKVRCKIEGLSDAELVDKAGSVSKLADSWLRAWHMELEMEINAIKTGKPLPVSGEPEEEASDN